MDRDDFQTEVEIFAKAFFSDGFFQVLIGGGEDAHIGFENVAAADTAVFVILQNPQQFGLEVEGDVADLIQKQRAAFGQLELAQAPVHGAGEGAFFMAEQLALQQLPRYGGAVDGDEGLVPARRIIMDCLCDQFLAGAALAQDQNGRGVVDHLADGLVDALHGGAGADDIDAGLEAFFDFLFELAKIAGQFAAVHGALDQDQHFVEVEGLGDVIEGAVFHGADGVAHGVLRGHQDHRRVDAVVLEFLEQR